MTSAPMSTPAHSWIPPFGPDEKVLDDRARIAAGPHPVFGEDRWDCAAMGLAANVRPNQVVVDFTKVHGPWRQVAKTIAMARLNPTHPAIFARGLYLSNRPAAVKTVRAAVDGLRYLETWARGTGRPDQICEWSAEDCHDCLADARGDHSVWRWRSAFGILHTLQDYGPLLEGGGLTAEVPAVPAAHPSGELSTPVIPPDVVWPLVRACWTYIDVFAPDLLAARDDLEQLDALVDQPGAKATSADIDQRLEQWLARPDAFIPVHVVTVGRGVKGAINWSGLSTLIGCKIGGISGPGGPARRGRVQEAIRGGVPERAGITATRPAIVDRPDGRRGPWCPGFELANVRREITNLRDAAYIFVGLMTMMRDSEIQGIPVGCLGTRYGAPVIHSMVVKDRGPGGQPDSWWVSDPVVKAIEVAEKITLSPARIFGSLYQGTQRELRSFDVHDEIGRFTSWVTAHSPDNGLDPIPDFRLAPHMFRRTMAVITANEPDGEIALGITLKHNATRALANSLTSGYGAPTPDWAREFRHQAQDVAAGELVADWARHTAGQPIARGPGATTFLAGLDDVTGKVADNPVKTGDERLLRDMLRDEFSTIELGPLNHCLGVTADAQCLKNLTDEARGAGPLRSLCSPTTCKNSVITETHMPVWLAEEADLAARLKDRRMATVHRQRLQAQLDQVRSIIRQEPT
ncbi:MAG: hypothetical protein SOH99_10450 [Acidipropionibacterium acidipropionici]|jgi:hypothetical protein|uniref:hypothetical protein n=1 Tax=Acidipropionibacterium acidipropionici TaxID=1748 RepID=UPI002F356469